MKTRKWLAAGLVVGIVGGATLLIGAEPPAKKADPPPKPAEAKPAHSAAYDWLEVVLEAAAREVERDGARPTILSRSMAVAVTAMYDAWAAYDDKAVGTRLGGKLRRPLAERTQANKEK